MSNQQIEISVENSLGEKLADIAMQELAKEKIEWLVKRCLDKTESWGSTSYWTHNATDLEKKVYEAFYRKIVTKIDEILESDMESQEVIKQTAERIVANSRESAERYLTEAIANRMCLIGTDFTNSANKLDIHRITNDIIRAHLDSSHRSSY